MDKFLGSNLGFGTHVYLKDDPDKKVQKIVEIIFDPMNFKHYYGLENSGNHLYTEEKLCVEKVVEE